MYKELLDLSDEDYDGMILARVWLGLAQSEEEAIRYYFNKGREAVLKEYQAEIDEILA